MAAIDTRPPSLIEHDPAARARLVSPQLPPLRSTSRGSIGLGLDDTADPLGAATELRMRRRYFMRGYEDATGAFPRHGHYDCVLDHEGQVDLPGRYITDRFKMSFVDTLEADARLPRAPTPELSFGPDGETGMTLEADEMARWLCSTAPYIHPSVGCASSR